jgi:hypothetical protein
LRGGSKGVAEFALIFFEALRGAFAKKVIGFVLLAGKNCKSPYK